VPRGPVWGAESDELNATLLEWPPGDGPGETASKLDVLYVVVAGSLALTVAGERHELAVGDALIVEKDVPREPVAGPDGVRYLTAHRRRGLLHLAPSQRGS
jgi:quercetin dioxygenase-like cupin family protein